MRLRVRQCVRTVGVVVLMLAAWSPRAAEAQTTVVLSAPDSQVVDATIRGGSYANTNYGSDVLATRASSTLDYARRALLKFDTENTIPSKASIQSATLTVTIKASNSLTRTLSAYRVSSSWDEGSTTWNVRRTSEYWGTSGGDLAALYTQTSAGTSAGTKISFDVTKLVQETVNGSYGSRYTRIAIVDSGSSTSDSYKEFYSSESSDSTVRPKLTVVYGSTTSTSTSGSTSSGSTSTSSTGTTIKLLQWNVHHGGIGTDGVYDPGRIASWIASINPHVVSLNEVDDTSQVNAIVSKLNSLTGRTWSTMFGGAGNLLISRIAVDSKTTCTYNPSYPRVAPQMKVTYNGRSLSFWSVHLAVDSSTTRLSEVKALQNCALSWPEARIFAGDYNMQYGSTEYNQAVVGYSDAWLAAKAIGRAVNYSGNCDGCTRNSRIDYVFASKGATFVTMNTAQIIDTRDANGIMPSDHKPMLVTYNVN